MMQIQIAYDYYKNYLFYKNYATNIKSFDINKLLSFDKISNDHSKSNCFYGSESWNYLILWRFDRILVTFW